METIKVQRKPAHGQDHSHAEMLLSNYHRDRLYRQVVAGFGYTYQRREGVDAGIVQCAPKSKDPEKIAASGKKVVG